MSRAGDPVVCERCGRRYPPERLAAGRSLQCACGQRVGRWRRTGLREQAGETRFFADVMLARLARWLRALGYDVAWEARIDDAELVARAVAEERLILTRDRRLPQEWWLDSVVLVEADRPLDQLSEIARKLHLRPGRLFSRCTQCNCPLRAAAPQRRADLPQALRAAHSTIRECPACQRLYWEGSHTERMRRAMEEALDGEGA